MVSMDINGDGAGFASKMDGLPHLHSPKSTRRLEQIANLRARGIGDHIGLPQLVVCGDQSAGKSSVLEGITGFPFPRQDGVCTRFATEIILQHSQGDTICTASILPARSRSNERKSKLQQFERKLAGFDELPAAIAAAGATMGIRGFDGVQLGPAFVEDVLRIKVSGPTGLNLTIVDLPGLFSVPSEEQSDEDMQTVHSLVDAYVASSRTIILAVVQAGNDIANQSIIRKSRLNDKSGKRTIGVITKPDLINKGTAERIALLAKNQDTTKLKLGYFILKNPAPEEIEHGMTPERRAKEESQFFESPQWKDHGLDKNRVGIVALRSYLQTLLDQHIEQELPQVRNEIKSLLEKVELDAATLGDERPTAGQRRMFLSRLAMRFHGLTTSALNGTYHEADIIFFDVLDKDNSTRLRAMIHKLNTEFADHMRDYGEKRKIVTASERTRLTMQEDSHEENNGDEWRDSASKEQDNSQLLVTQSEMKEWIKEIYVKSRGKELPGNYNHVLLSELFFNQSSRWRELADGHVTTMCEIIDDFVREALAHIIKDEQVHSDVREIASSGLQRQRKEANMELTRLLEDERQQPITYNHYYTENVQKSRKDATRKLIKKAIAENETMEQYVTKIDGVKLLASLEHQIVVNMDEQACTEALAGLQAYYKVALKTFVDNVCRQVIERHLVRRLPDIFCPETVAALSEEELERIAAESPANIHRRKELRELQEDLRESLSDLRK